MKFEIWGGTRKLTEQIEGWERKRSMCFFTYIHLDLFRFHPSKYETVLTYTIPRFPNKMHINFVPIVPCGQGSFFSDDICKPCAIGSYQDQEGQYSCVKCPKGKSTIGILSTNIDECVGRCQFE